jgi:hypothetical protein
MIKTAKKIARKKGIKHGIFLVSLFTSIGMLLFSHYAYAGSLNKSFGGKLDFQYKPPFFCRGQYAPFSLTPAQNPNQPVGYGEISSSSRHMGGKILDGVAILGLYDPTPSTNCYMQIGPYQYTIKTTIYTYFGTSEAPSFGN